MLINTKEKFPAYIRKAKSNYETKLKMGVV